MIKSFLNGILDPIASHLKAEFLPELLPNPLLTFEPLSKRRGQNG